MHDKRKNCPIFLGKKIKHKMFDEEEVKDIWYQGIVTQVLGDNETSDDCDLTVKYKDFDDIYEVMLVEGWRDLFAIILGEADEKNLKIMKITCSP